MSFNRNLPLKARLVERRRTRRKKLKVIFTLLLLASAFAIVIMNTNMIESIKTSVFMASPAPQTTPGVQAQPGGSNGGTTAKSTPVGDANQSITTPKPTGGGGNSAITPTPAGNGGYITVTPKPTGDGGNGAAGSQSPNTNKSLQALKSDIQKYLKGFKGTYGVYYINLVDGTQFGINENITYTAASTVKVPINLYLFKKIKQGTVKPTTKMTYTSADYEGGTGSLQYKKVGSRYTIRELSRLSIEVSDNVATNMLIRLLGRQNYKNYMRELGGKVVDNRKNLSCPKDMAIYMKKVYEFYKSEPVLGGELMGYLENTVFPNRIPQLLPKGTRVAHKIGNYAGSFHDVGVVFADEPYVISVMSKGVTEQTSYNVIANISKKVYDYVTAKSKTQ